MNRRIRSVLVCVAVLIGPPMAMDTVDLFSGSLLPGYHARTTNIHQPCLPTAMIAGMLHSS